MLIRIAGSILIAAGLAACSKVPESEAAKKVGSIPKQTIDKASTDVNKAIQQGADRTREAEQKQ